MTLKFEISDAHVCELYEERQSERDGPLGPVIEQGVKVCEVKGKSPALAEGATNIERINAAITASIAPFRRGLIPCCAVNS